MDWKWTGLASVALVLCSGCRHEARTFGDNDGFPDNLSAWNLFVGTPSDLKPNDRVVSYNLNTPLFSDYATKRRVVWMPPGTAASYSDSEAFEFPVGTVFAKSFSYPDAATGKEKLIETRILVRTGSGWYGLPYVWNAAQTDAKLETTPNPVPVIYTHASGEKEAFEYAIPNANQCKGCHEKSKMMTPLGPRARNLNRDRQLEQWTQAGILKGAPVNPPRAAVWNDPGSGTLEARALVYLDVNCAHCHSPGGPANTSGLYLTYNQTDPLRLGFRKVPVSAGNGSGGLLYDTVAGHPEQSILVHRMESSEPKILMPELGRSLVHREGVALIREWIRHRT